MTPVSITVTVARNSTMSTAKLTREVARSLATSLDAVRTTQSQFTARW